MFPIRDHQPSGIVPFITWAIVAVTAYMFWLELTAPDPEAFIEQWALVPSDVDFSNLNSLIPFFTSIFLHGGFLHIISNMWFLLIFGDNVEAALGRIKYLLFYIAGGVVAGLTQYYFVSGEAIPMLGASGAVAAVLGYYFLVFSGHTVSTLVPLFVFVTIVQIPARLLLFMWFILQFFSGAASLGEAGVGEGVAWWAHVGGFVFGMLVALVVRPRSKSSRYY